MGQLDTSNVTQNMVGGGLGIGFTPVFGNMNFQILPSQTGEVNVNFGTIPYFALESLIQAQATPSVDPTRIGSGSSQGNSVIQGQTSIQDGNGLTRMVMGYVPGGF
jgi:hypothetical protein